MTSQESKKKFVRATVGKSGEPPQLAASFILERRRGQSAARTASASERRFSRAGKSQSGSLTGLL